MKKAGFAVAVVFALAIGMTGCSSPQEEAPAKPENAGQAVQETEASVEDPVVSETGYYIGDYGEVFIGFIVENPNEDVKLNDVSLQITIRDGDGNILDTDPEFKIGDLLPGEVFGMGTSLFADDPSTVASAEVKAVFDGSDESSELVPIVVNQANIGSSGFGIVGEIENVGDDEVSDAMVGVVFRDSSGAMVGGGFTDVRDVPSGETSTFDIPYSAPDGTTVEAYGHVYH